MSAFDSFCRMFYSLTPAGREVLRVLVLDFLTRDKSLEITPWN